MRAKTVLQVTASDEDILSSQFVVRRDRRAMYSFAVSTPPSRPRLRRKAHSSRKRRLRG